MIYRIIPTVPALEPFPFMQAFEPTTFIEPPHWCLATLESCRIRTCRSNDADAIRQWLDAPEIWRFVMDDKPAVVTMRHAELYLSVEHAKPRCLTFAVASLEEDRLIGVLQAQFGEFANAHSAELAGWLARPYWGSGVPRQTTTVFTDWLFSERHALRVYAAPFHPNRASIGTLEACGFSFEGRLRAAAFKNGQVMDQMMYAKLSPSTEFLPRAAGRPPRRQPVEPPPAPNETDWA